MLNKFPFLYILHNEDATWRPLLFTVYIIIQHEHSRSIAYEYIIAVEAFVVCREYCPPDDYVPSMANPLLDHKYGMSGLQDIVYRDLLVVGVHLLAYTEVCWLIY